MKGVKEERMRGEARGEKNIRGRGRQTKWEEEKIREERMETEGRRRRRKYIKQGVWKRKERRRRKEGETLITYTMKKNRKKIEKNDG